MLKQNIFQLLYLYDYPLSVELNPVVSSADKNSLGVSVSSNSTKVVYPDTSKMVIYDPRQKFGMPFFLWFLKAELVRKILAEVLRNNKL